MLLAALILSPAATESGAQDAPAMSPNQQAARRRDEETRQVISRYGKCVVRRKADAASTFVLAHQKSKELQGLTFNDISDRYCLGFAGWDQVVGAYFPSGTLRYTLAEALVLKEFSGNPAQSFAHVPALPPSIVDPADFQPKPGQRVSKRRNHWLEQSRTAATVAAYMSAYGECVVRTDPVGSHRLLMTEVTTPQESVELGKLKPALAACIPNQQKMAFNKAGIRGAIAVNYYRLAKASSLAGHAGESAKQVGSQ